MSARLNHSTINITAAVYSHVTPPIASEAADRIGAIILARPISPESDPGTESKGTSSPEQS